MAGEEPVVGDFARPRAEWGLVRVAFVLRAVVLAQAAVAVPAGLRESPHRGLYLACAGAVLVTSIGLLTVFVRARSIPGAARPWRWLDLGLGVVMMPLLALAVPPEQIVGTWQNWAPGYAVNTVTLASAWLSARASVGYSAVVSVAYVVTAQNDPTAAWPTELGNTLTYPAFAVAIAGFIHYLRGLADSADEARAEAVRATRELELERYRLTVHDAAGILRQLGDPRTPDEVVPALQRQAQVEARRLRSFVLRDPIEPADGHPRTLGAVLSAALYGFGDLPLEVAIDLGAEFPLEPPTSLAVERAVTTILHNVRRHADADTVFVHADAIDDGWEVVIRDDGTGFDPEADLGFGLEVQVFDALARHRIAVTIDTAPGEGTAVTLTSCAEEVAADG